MVEVAKQICGFEGKYTVDRDGNVFNIYSGKYLKHRMIGDIRVVDLRNDEYHTTLSVNKLVYDTYKEKEVEVAVKYSTDDTLKDSLIRAYEFKIEVLEEFLEEERAAREQLQLLIEDMKVHLRALDLLVEFSTETEERA